MSGPNLVSWVWMAHPYEIVIATTNMDIRTRPINPARPPQLRVADGTRLYIMVTLNSVDLVCDTRGEAGQVYGNGIWPDIWPEYLVHVHFNAGKAKL